MRVANSKQLCPSFQNLKSTAQKSWLNGEALPLHPKPKRLASSPYLGAWKTKPCVATQQRLDMMSTQE